MLNYIQANNKVEFLIGCFEKIQNIFFIDLLYDLFGQ